MKFDNELLYSTFHHFNHLIFGGDLPQAEIRVYNSKINCGFFEGEYNENGEKEYLIKISKYYNKNYTQFCETLVHEMIHCYQFLNNMPVDHGKEFNKMVKIIKKHIGLNVE